VPAEGGDARQREDRRRFQGKGRPDQGNRREQRHGGGGQRQDRPPAQRPQRERPIDPNSPFAKLAALKEQLESNAKEKL
jgi:ATP-dependent RNA helicase SUPV3L1/SUV3